MPKPPTPEGFQELPPRAQPPEEHVFKGEPIAPRKRRERTPPHSLRISTTPEQLENFRQATFEAYSDYFGFDVPMAMVARCLMRLFVRYSVPIRDTLPHREHIHLGARSFRPPSGDREAWQELEEFLFTQMLRRFDFKAQGVAYSKPELPEIRSA